MALSNSAPILIETLIKRGWRHSIAKHAMIGPDGQEVGMDLIHGLTADPIPPPMVVKGGPIVDWSNDHFRFGPATIFPDNMSNPDKKSKWNNYEKLAMRLGMAPGEKFPFDNVHIVKGPNRTFVFIVKDDKAVILDDDNSLFPSDKIVGQVRLFQD